MKPKREVTVVARQAPVPICRAFTLFGCTAAAKGNGAAHGYCANHFKLADYHRRGTGKTWEQLSSEGKASPIKPSFKDYILSEKTDAEIQKEWRRR